MFCKDAVGINFAQVILAWTFPVHAFCYTYYK